MATTEDEAAFWFARLRSASVGPGDRARFDDWVKRSPAHAAAYADCEAMWAGVQEIAANEAILAMRKQALALGPHPRHFHWEKLTALAATVAIFLFAGMMLFRDQPASDGGTSTTAQASGSNIYRTAVGQRSSIMLTDGSVVELNTASVIQVNYSQGRRDVRLLRGQALFEVARDSGRPFVVEAGGQRVTALGTSFEVLLRTGETRVTLIEGEVEVERRGEGAEPQSAETRRLRPGELLIAAAQRPFVVQPANVDQALSWRTGRVIFADEPLGEVIEEINRYSVRKLVLGDPSLASLRVSGVFRAGSVGSFVTALNATFPVASRIDESSNTIVLTWQ